MEELQKKEEDDKRLSKLESIKKGEHLNIVTSQAEKQKIVPNVEKQKSSSSSSSESSTPNTSSAESSSSDDSFAEEVRRQNNEAQ